MFLKKTRTARDFTNTNKPNNTNEPDGLLSWSFVLEIYLYSVDSHDSCPLKTNFVFLKKTNIVVFKNKYRGLKIISVLCGIRVGQSKKDYTVCLSLHSVGVQPSFSLKRR